MASAVSILTYVIFVWVTAPTGSIPRTAEVALFALFAIEIILRFFSARLSVTSSLRFFQDQSNALDAVAFSMSAIIAVVNFFAGNAPTSLFPLTSLRMVRLIKIASEWKLLRGTALVLRAVVSSIAQLANVGLLVSTTICLFAIASLYLFPSEDVAICSAAEGLAAADVASLRPCSSACADCVTLRNHGFSNFGTALLLLLQVFASLRCSLRRSSL